jgi:hypothetical protein
LVLWLGPSPLFQRPRLHIDLDDDGLTVLGCLQDVGEVQLALPQFLFLGSLPKSERMIGVGTFAIQIEDHSWEMG